MSHSLPRLRFLALGLVAAFLVAWTAICVAFGVDLPFLDQWYRPLGPIVHLRQGTFGFVPDLFAQHNEARKVVPTSLSIAFAVVRGRYDPHAELAIGLVLFGLIALALARLARAGRMGPLAAAALPLAYLAIAGSRRSDYFHLYSVTFERLLPELALVASLALLVARGPGARSMAGVAAMLVVAQYSYPGAVVLWILVPALAAAAFPRARRTPLVLLVACGALSSLAYFWTYSRPPEHTPVAAVLDRPVFEWLLFASRFLGNPMASSPLMASLGAGACSVTLVAATAVALRRAAADRPRVLAWLTLGAYSVSQAILATMTRLPMGLYHAQRPDYLVHASYLYVATAALLWLAWPSRWLPVAIVTGAALSLALLFTPAYLRHLGEMRDERLKAKACVLQPSCRGDSFWLMPSLEVLREHADAARAAGVW